jgi:integration host factor subunit alpha
MTKVDIVEQVFAATGMNKKVCADMVDKVFSIIKSTLESGENFKISGFGKFEVQHKKSRKGRNPQTGEDITIEARKIVTFKPSTLLKQEMNK